MAVEVHLAMDVRPPDVGRAGDCSIRALSTFMDLPYREVEELVKAHANYSPYRGVLNFDFYALLRDLGLTRVDARIRLNSKYAHEKLPRKCLLIFRTHVVAYENGKIFDTFNTLNVPGCKQTIAYFH